MATNFVRKTGAMSLPVHAGTASGDPVLVGDTLPGVAITDISGGLPLNPAGSATVQTWGVFDVLVDTTTGAAITAIGQPIYYNIAGDVLSTLNTDVLWGYAMELIGAATADTIQVAIAKLV